MAETLPAFVCNGCGKTFYIWPTFHYWFTRMGNRLICLGSPK